jgi:hypothetical protein
MTFLDRVIGKDIVLEEHPILLDPIKADLAQVEQVLMNLCIKARGAMPDPGRDSVNRAGLILEAFHHETLHAGIVFCNQGARTSASRAKFEMRKDSGSQAAQVM